jgi:hypothetical protein
MEVLVPLAFIGLMCLPRLLISDEQFGLSLHRPAPLSSFSWSGRAPADGAYELVYGEHDDQTSSDCLLIVHQYARTLLSLASSSQA